MQSGVDYVNSDPLSPFSQALGLCLKAPPFILPALVCPRVNPPLLSVISLV